MLKCGIGSLARDTLTVFRVLRHPKAPTSARLKAAMVIGFVFSPIQLIPTFIPVSGQIDDLFVVSLGAFFVRRLVNPKLLLECSQGGV